MPRRFIAVGIAAILVSAAATLAATVLYFILVFGEWPDPFGAVYIAIAPTMRGVLLAIPAAVAFTFLRGRVNRLVFVVLVTATAALIGALIGVWFVGNSPHISARIAAALLALTWAIAAAIPAAVAVRPPN